MTKWLAWSMWSVCLVLVTSGLVLLLATTAPFALERKTQGGVVATAAWVVVYLAFATVGALIVSRRAADAAGWLCCTLGLTQAVSFFAHRYAAYALFQAPDVLPAGEWAAWVGYWISSSAGGQIALLMLLVPTGRLPSPRWRPVALLGVGVVIAQALALMVKPGPMTYSMPSGYLHNPAGTERLRALAETLSRGGSSGTLLLLVASIVSLILRYRRAQGQERRQIRPVAAAGAVFALVFVAILLAIPLGLGGLSAVLLPVGLATIPIAVGIAALGHR